MTKTLSDLERRLAPLLEAGIADVTPGVVLQVHRHGQLVADLRVGRTARLYDFASLTKIVFARQALLQAFDRGLWHEASTVGDFLPDFSHPSIRLAELLTHTSGATWWMPFYESVDRALPWRERRKWLYRQLQAAPCAPAGQAVYSDLGFMLLGFLLEVMHGRDLLAVWQELQADAYPGSTLAMHEDNRPHHPAEHYAPTEQCPWRGKRLQGEVHDDNTWSLGGISTHAGLFGSIEDLARFGLLLRAQVRQEPEARVRPQTAQWFTRRAIPRSAGDWAPGLMMPSLQGASCGRHFSTDALGHTGFTGTSLWYDPARDLLVCILSNRVYGGRENKAFLALRPQIHDWIVEAL